MVSTDLETDGIEEFEEVSAEELRKEVMDIISSHDTEEVRHMAALVIMEGVAQYLCTAYGKEFTAQTFVSLAEHTLAFGEPVPTLH